MSNLAVFIGFLIATACFLGTAFFSEIRSARGIFITFMLAGSILPFSVAYLTGFENPTVVHPLVSALGIKAAFLCIVALAVVIWVSLFVEKTTMARTRALVYGANAKVAVTFAVLSLLFSITYIVFMAARQGGFVEMVIRLYQRVSFNDSIANTLSVFYFASSVFAVFAFTFARGCARRGVKRFVYFSVLFCIAQTLLLGGRSLVILLVLSLFYVTLIKMPLRRFVIAGLAGLAAIALLSFVMTNLRFEAQGGYELRARSDESFLSRASTGLTFMDHFAASMRYTQAHGHDYGKLYLNALAMPVPRDLWPGKPIQISIQLRKFLYGDMLGGAPPGLLGESFIAFGSIGVVLASIVLGWMVGRIDVATTISVRTGCRMREALAGVLAPQISYAIVRGGFDIGVLRVGLPALFCLISVYLAKYIIAGRKGVPLSLPPRRPHEAFRRPQPGRSAIAARGAFPSR